MKQVDTANLLRIADRLAARAPDNEDEYRPPPPTPDELWRGILHAGGVPPRYLEIPMDLELHADAVGWRGDPEFITFLGTVGTGKTWQATRLFGDWRPELRQKGITSFWIDCAEAVEKIRAEIATDNDGKTLRRLTDTHLLLLDDLLAERDTEFSRDKLSFILRHRHAHMLPTIITSNSVDKDGNPSLDAITKLDPRLSSRIAEGRVIKMGGRDKRLPARPLPVSHDRKERR